MARKVMICDDEPFILESMCYIVKKEGFDLITAEDGQRVIEIVHNEMPDLMFLDISMPKLSGYEVCRLLKDNPDTMNIYIIMLTAHGQIADERQAREAGADEFMVKPFSPRAIQTKLHEILGNGKGVNDEQR